MEFPKAPSSLFINNRKNFAERMKPDSLAIFHSNDVMPRNADNFYAFRQNNDFFYLTGIDQEESILLLYPDAPKNEWKEVLFLTKTSEHIRIWEGEKYTQQQATEISGIKNVKWLENFETTFNTMMNYTSNVYINTNEHDRFSSEVPDKNLRKARELRIKFPAHEFTRSSPIMHELRAIKAEAEIELTKKACEITKKGFNRVLNFVKPDVWEYQIEAEITHEFLMNRGKHAYDPIIASGENSNVLHYVTNNKQCKSGDIILFDFGAEYGNYCSDLSRTIPVNGRYSQRQRQVYDAVLRVFKAAKNMLRPGTILDEYHVEVGKIMEKELVDLGLLTMNDINSQDPETPAYKKYFMHGTSHFLGLDTHDVGNRYKPMQAGMVFTCEPGIYIRDEGFGVRLENDILVTEGEPVDLMADIPIEAQEIEDEMNRK
jgi:Xaa-Pro aminopeptidase